MRDVNAILIVALTAFFQDLAAVAAVPISIVAFGDSTTAPRNVGATLNGRPAGQSTYGENFLSSQNPPHNKVNIVTQSSPMLYVYSDLLRDKLPGRGISIEAVDNEGIGANRTDQGKARLTTDIMAKSPDYVIVQFGINDSWWDAGQPADVNNPDSSGSRVALDFLAQTGGDGNLGNGNDHPFASRGNYTDNLTQIVHQLKAANVKVILMTPNQISPTAEPLWRNTLLGQYAQVVRNVATSEKTFLIDAWKLYGDYAALPGRKIDDLLLDLEHPNAAGHALEADALINLIAVPESSCSVLFGSGAAAIVAVISFRRWKFRRRKVQNAPARVLVRYGRGVRAPA